MTASGLLPDTLTDRGNAKLFAELYAGDYRHVPGPGWYRWDGTRWQIDEDDTVLWAAGDLAEHIATDDPQGVHSAQALQHHRRRALSTAGMNAMPAQARAAPGMVLNAALLDADRYALCTPAGIVDLCTGRVKCPISGTYRRRVFRLLPHDRDSAPKDPYGYGAPSEAVDPRTVAPGVKGYKTERCEGGPPSTAMRELGITLPKA